MELAKTELDVGLVGADVDGLRKFYGDVMGFAEAGELSLGELGHQYRFRVGNHLVKINRMAREQQTDEGGTNKAIGIRLLAFVLDDFDALLARMDEAGHAYRRMRLPDDAPFQVAFSSDPDGNALELVGLRKPAGERLKARMQIGLTVGDAERTRQFYRDVLGLPEQAEMKLPKSMGVQGDTRYACTFGSTTVKFWQMPGELPHRTGGPDRRTGIRMFTALVKDLEAAHRELSAAGAPIKMAPRELDGGATVMFVADPDGNWIELVQAPAA